VKPAGFLFHWFSVVVVTGYMAVCACWLLLRGRIDGRPLRLWLRELFRRRWRGPLGDVRAEHGKCFVASVPERLLSDSDLGSRLVVLEDGVPLPQPHALHDDIREHGAGRYSHCEGGVWFAASDDTDPRSNGRTYTAEER